MIAVVVAAALTCGGALLVGEAVCWLCGARAWTFLAPPVGLAVLMLVSVTAIHAPGRASTLAVLLALLVIAAAVLLVTRPELRPRASDLLVAVPTFALTLVPFVASGRAGTLGVNFDNDMVSHLLIADAIRSSAVTAVTGLDPSYPLGPHALVAVISQGIGVRVDYVFAGVTMAAPILLAWTSLSVLSRVGWPGRTFVATLTAMPVLVAGYYGQGSFKEIMQALFVLAFACGLQAWRAGDRLRLVPLGIILGGSLSVYSVTGLPWLVATAAVWLAGLGLWALYKRRSLLRAWTTARADALAVALAGVVLLVLITPQLPRLVRFYDATIGTAGGTGISMNNLGNLPGPLAFWKVFGIADNPDYRLPAADPFHMGMLVAFGLALTLVGVIWWLAHSDFAVPAAAGVSLVIWFYSEHHQSPYVAAKALVILSPLVLLLATRPLVELRTGESWISASGVVRLGLAAFLGWAVLGSSLAALRYSNVGPTNHVDDLRALQPYLGRAQTLFLGSDDFIQWELAGTPVVQPFLGYALLPMRPQKAYAANQAEDFDELPSAMFNRFTYVIEPRDPAGSEPPSNMHLVRTTKYYWVFKRVGPTPNRQILDEGQEPAAVLNCGTPAGRAIAAQSGVAAIRAPNVEVPVPVLSPGETYRVTVPLHAGAWWLTVPYVSPHPVDVTAPGLSTTLPANLDRGGNRWLIGRIVVSRAGPITVTLHVQNPFLDGPDPTYINEVVATLDRADQLIPLRSACGRNVDWYTTG